MNIEIDGDSLLGTRTNQQDSYIYSKNKSDIIAILCDGMGGMNGGEQASNLVVKMLKDNYRNKASDVSIPDFLESEIEILDDAVLSLKDCRGTRLNAGTTIVAVVIEQDKLYYMSVGDSRLFIQRDNQLVPINREHNYRLKLDALLEEGIISEADYKKEEHRADHLISYLGSGNVTVWDVSKNPITLLEGDRILICSDGVTKPLPEEIINQLLEISPTAKHMALNIRASIEKLNLESQDNATFICAMCK